MFAHTLSVPPDLVISPWDHVHHADILKFMEEARLAYLAELGFPIESFLEQQLFLVIVSVQARYKREIKGGEISVTCEEPLIDGKSLQLVQKIYNKNEKLAVEGRIESMFMSGHTKRSVVPPEEFAAAFVGVTT